jgi:protein-S-isoprenylcysteine O-methyltransferase Ste14
MADDVQLFLGAVAAFLAMPFMVAFVVPWLIRPADASFHAAGAPVLAVGIVVLLWCVRDFYVAGRGTLAPWSPPKHLVRVGLYRYSRNPMYVGVVCILVGWAMVFQSTALWIYAGVLALAFHLRVVLNEEPWLAETHGDEWTMYRADVFRWLGRRRRRGEFTHG